MLLRLQTPTLFPYTTLFRSEFDELGRPAWLFGETVHRHCPRAGYYEEGVFAREYGDKECLVELGCWGPVVQALLDRKSTRLNSSHQIISYAVFCLKKKKKTY